MTISRLRRAGYPTHFGWILLLFIVLFHPVSVGGEELAEISAARFWKNQDFVRFVFDISKPVEFTNTKLSNPERLLFDLKNTKLAKGIQKSYEVNYDFVKSVRIGQYNADTARIVFDLKTSVYNFKVMNLDDPTRLVIDIYVGGTKKEDLHVEQDNEQLRPDEKSVAELKQAEPVQTVPAEKFIRRTVVIDAGHGGHDPGAIGPGGVYEKNVVLDIACKVRDLMKKNYPFYNIILTRDTDVFIPLPERAAIANRNNADLFVSIHANSSPNRKARGFETYLLNWTDDVEAMKVAARENAISLKKMKQAKGDLGIILASLERESKRDESVKVAGNIQNSLSAALGKKYPETSNLGVKQALFYVLVGAKMPSSLVEVSFISNPTEEKLLSNDAYKLALARSIAEGIHKYFSSHPAQHLAMDENENGNVNSLAKPVKYTKKKAAR